MGSTVLQTLVDVTGGLKEMYSPRVGETFDTFIAGAPISKLMPETKPVYADGLNFKYETEVDLSARMTKNHLGNWDRYEGLNAQNVKLRYDESNAAADDFGTILAAIRLTHTDIVNAPSGPRYEGHIYKLVEKVTRNLERGIEMQRALKRITPISGRVATLNGVLKLNDSELWEDASAWSNGTVGRIRISTETGSIVHFIPGMEYDLTDSSGAKRVTITCVDVNRDESSFGFTSEATITTSAYSGGSIHLSGEGETRFLGPRAWYDRPVSGENFMGGRDRTDPASRFLLPTSVQVTTGSAKKINRNVFNDAGNAVEMSLEDGGDELMAYMGTKMFDSLRYAIGGDNLNTTTTGGDSKNPTFGSKSLTYYHPALGDLPLMGDPRMSNDQIWLHNKSCWEALQYGGGGIEFFGGDDGSYFYRTTNTADGGGGGRTQEYEMDVKVSALADVCLDPHRNVVIRGIKP